MPTVSQILAASYPAVIAAMKKPANQWAESALMRELDKQNGIKKISMGPTIEEPLDYRRSPNSGFLATDLETTSLTKTDVLTTAVYTPGQLSVEMVWSKGDEAKNPSENQKVALVKSIIENGAETHDDLIEEALFAAATDGFLGLLGIYPDSGQGNVGGIDSAADAWWRHYTATYAAAGTNIQAQLTKAFNEAAKGTGGSMPTLLVSDGDTQAIYEGSIQTLARYIDVEDAKVGFRTLAFKTGRYVFSPYGGTRIYGFNTKHTNLKSRRNSSAIAARRRRSRTRTATFRSCTRCSSSRRTTRAGALS